MSWEARRVPASPIVPGPPVPCTSTRAPPAARLCPHPSILTALCRRTRVPWCGVRTQWPGSKAGACSWCGCGACLRGRRATRAQDVSAETMRRSPALLPSHALRRHVGSRTACWIWREQRCRPARGSAPASTPRGESGQSRPGRRSRSRWQRGQRRQRERRGRRGRGGAVMQWPRRAYFVRCSSTTRTWRNAPWMLWWQTCRLPRRSPLAHMTARLPTAPPAEQRPRVPPMLPRWAQAYGLKTPCLACTPAGLLLSSTQHALHPTGMPRVHPLP
jgi:hypothetical protein